MMIQDVDDDNKIYHSAEEDKSNQDHALEDNEEEQMMIHDVGNADKEENCSKAEESSNYCSKAEVEDNRELVVDREFVEDNRKFVEAGNQSVDADIRFVDANIQFEEADSQFVGIDDYSFLDLEPPVAPVSFPQHFLLNHYKLLKSFDHLDL